LISETYDNEARGRGNKETRQLFWQYSSSRAKSCSRDGKQAKTTECWHRPRCSDRLQEAGAESKWMCQGKNGRRWGRGRGGQGIWRWCLPAAFSCFKVLLSCVLCPVLSCLSSVGRVWRRRTTRLPRLEAKKKRTSVTEGPGWF
jgi:hypothetical protein